MAEVAIPVVALGAMWLISNDEEKEATNQFPEKVLIMYPHLINVSLNCWACKISFTK